MSCARLFLAVHRNYSLCDVHGVLFGVKIYHIFKCYIKVSHTSVRICATALGLELRDRVEYIFNDHILSMIYNKRFKIR